MAGFRGSVAGLQIPNLMECGLNLGLASANFFHKLEDTQHRRTEWIQL
jgi:hypothetical protein